MAQEISSTSKSAVETPEDIICPITGQIMTDPVMLIETGHTYEREAILKWLEKNNTDPSTNMKLKSKLIAPNVTVKKMIVSFLEKNKSIKPGLIEDTYLPESLIKSLIESIQKNDSKAFKEFLDKDNRLLRKDLKDNKNLLILGCESASLKILTLIIEKLGNTLLKSPYVEKDKGLSLFLMVSRRIGLEGSRILYKAFQWEGSDIQSLLTTAVKDNDLVIAQIALSLGASANLDLLNQVYAAKKTEMFKLLVSAGAPVEEKDKADNDFLMRAIQDNYVELSLFLLFNVKEKINPNTTNSAKETALHTAVEKKQFEVVSALLNHPKIDIHQLDAKNDTALHIAVRGGDLKIAELLIKNKAVLNAKTAKGESSLDIAYKNKHLEMQKLLINAGAETGDLLFKAIEDGQKALIHFLLTEAADKIDINLSNSKGQSALMLAAEKSQPETLSLLLNHLKINIHQTDPSGNKALHYAATAGHQECVKLLMKKGCSIKDKNHVKKTPFQLAHEKGHQALSSWMEGKHRAKKIKPFIKPLKLEIEIQQAEIKNQKEKLVAQESVIKNQQAEIENLKKTQVLESAKTEKMIQDNLSFFTPSRKEMIVEQEKERERNQEEQRRREEERKYQAARERERQEQQRNAEIQKRQESLIAALLKGDLGEVKKLESQGASFEYPNKDGLYPLVAAVYGINLECVRYVEGKLKGEAVKQWSEVDANKALEKLNSQMPTDLPPNATYGDLGNWYLKYNGATWCANYDVKVLMETGEHGWRLRDWMERGEWVVESGSRKLVMNRFDWGSMGSYSPSVKVHENVVKLIREQLNELRNDVETKVKQSQSTAKRF